MTITESGLKYLKENLDIDIEARSEIGSVRSEPLQSSRFEFSTSYLIRIIKNNKLKL